MIQRYLELGNRNLVVCNVKTSDLNNREIPIVFEGDIDLSNYVITEDKELYLGIDFFPEEPDAETECQYYTAFTQTRKGLPVDLIRHSRADWLLRFLPSLFLNGYYPV